LQQHQLAITTSHGSHLGSIGLPHPSNLGQAGWGDKFAWMRPIDQDSHSAPSTSSLPPGVSVPTAPDIPQAIHDKLSSRNGHPKIHAQLGCLDGEDEAAM